MIFEISVLTVDLLLLFSYIFYITAAATAPATAADYDVSLHRSFGDMDCSTCKAYKKILRISSYYVSSVGQKFVLESHI